MVRRRKGGAVKSECENDGGSSKGQGAASYETQNPPPPPKAPSRPPRERDGDDSGEFSLRSPDIKVLLGHERPTPWWVGGSITFGIFLMLALFVWAQRFSLRLAGLFPFLHLGVMRGFNADDLGDMSGLVFVVTGASSGLGQATTKVLLSQNATVWMGCRSAERCQAALDEIRATVQRGTPRIATLELGSLRSVRAFAATVVEGLQPGGLDGLVLNAGFLPNSFRLSADGLLEETLAANHMGHFELTRLLLDSLLARSSSKVVAVSSGAHTSPWQTAAGVPMSVAEANDPANFDSVRTYGMTKLANILLVRELDRRYRDQGLVATAVNPGAVATNFLPSAMAGGKVLESQLEPIYRALFALKDLLFWDPLIASMSIVAAVYKPAGFALYTVPIARPMTPSEQAQNDTSALALWEWSEAFLMNN